MTKNNLPTNKKDALMAAAHSVFANKGYKKTNIADITVSANMAVGSFYNYFDSKEDIFLQVFIAENTHARQRVIEAVDWQAPTEQLIEQLFGMLLGTTRRNSILSEWTKPEIGPMLQQYYNSAAGRDNPFHQLILKVLRERLADVGHEMEEIERIIKTYELLYAIDCQATINTLPHYETTVQTLIRYFMKGVFIEKADGAEK